MDENQNPVPNNNVEPTPSPAPEAPAVQTPVMPVEVPTPPAETVPSEPTAAQPVTAEPALVSESNEPTVGSVAPTGPRRSRWTMPKMSKGLLALIAVVVLLGGTAAAYFGYVVPNKPENMWHSALVNTGKGYDKLTTYATTNKNTKGWSETGSFKFTGSVVADGTIKGESDGQTGNFNGTLSASGLQLGVDVRSFKSTGDTPDIYFKVSGLQGLGSLLGGFGADQSLGSALNGLNNQWYLVDHTLFDQYAKGANTNVQITSSDVSSILKAVGKASKQYVFTADDKKAAVVVKEQVGKEKLGNRSVYHYKVVVNKQNLKQYFDALCADLKTSKLSKILPSGNDINCTDMRRSVDNIKDDSTADAWVDTHTKLIRDIRFYDNTNKNNYFDIGQDFQGGSVFPFLFASHTKDTTTTTDLSLKLTLDTKANSFKLQGQLKASGAEAENGNVELTIVPNNAAVKVEKPANSKTIIQLLDDLGLGQLLSGGGSDGGALGGTQAKARDSKRQVDIQSLQVQLEAYFAQYGHYPSRADMNSASWRAANMRSLDSTALQDPQGNSKILVAQPTAHAYAYDVTTSGGASCESNDSSCAQYTLTATLETGGTYAKSNLD